MSITLGEKLRQAREERGISISEVAEQTRISPMYIESIEKDNYKPLPGGIFNKGFVKSYAKYVGIDEHEALQDYARQIAQTEEPIEDTHPRYRPEVLTDDARSASSIIPTVVFAAIILALMTVGILFAVNYIRNQPSSPAVVSNSGSNSAANSANVTAPPANSNPVPDGIRVEFKALSEKIAVTSTVDGTLASDEVLPEAPKVYTAQQSIKLRYYRGFADKVQITLNGKQLAPPALPARGNIEIEINRENVSRIYETGQLTPGAPATPVVTATPTATATAVATPAVTPVANASTPAVPRPTPSKPRPAFTPEPTPRRTPTPIVVGKPTATPN